MALSLHFQIALLEEMSLLSATMVLMQLDTGAEKVKRVVLV